VVRVEKEQLLRERDGVYMDGRFHILKRVKGKQKVDERIFSFFGLLQDRESSFHCLTQRGTIKTTKSPEFGSLTLPDTATPIVASLSSIPFRRMPFTHLLTTQQSPPNHWLPHPNLCLFPPSRINQNKRMLSADG